MADHLAGDEQMTKPACSRLAVPAIALVLAFAPGCGGSAARPTRHVDRELAEALQNTLDEQRAITGLTGVAAAVEIPGEGLWSGGSGVADRATGARVTGHTPFPIGSVTKTFVAALAVKLATQRRLRLDDALARWLPGWPNAGRISVRQLLGHRSGIDNFEARITDPYQRAIDAHPSRTWSPRRTLSYARRPEFAPGARFDYNNANYILAGLVIERATGSSVARELRRQLLDPLKLDDVVLQPQERVRGTPAHGYGAYTRDERRALRAKRTRFLPYDSIASSAWTGGGIVAGAAAVARWGDALLRDDVLDPSGRKQLLSFVAVDDGPAGYGLGVTRIRSPQDGTELWGHDGSLPGFGSSLWHLPSRGITAAVLANDGDSSHATRDTAALLIKAVVDHQAKKR
jgi:D-alanyl-D-alanine carboxypeptidase